MPSKPFNLRDEMLCANPGAEALVKQTRTVIHQLLCVYNVLCVRTQQ